MDVAGTLEKNIGSNSVVKFFKALDGSWYLIGNGGLGSLITMEVKEKEGIDLLNKVLEGEEMVYLNRNFIYEIGKEGHAYYYMPKE